MPEFISIKDAWKSKLIEDAEIFTPARLSALNRAFPNVRTLGDLAEMDERDLAEVEHFGRKTVSSIYDLLSRESYWAEADLLRAIVPFGGWAWQVYPVVTLPSLKVEMAPLGE